MEKVFRLCEAMEMADAGCAIVAHGTPDTGKESILRAWAGDRGWRLWPAQSIAEGRVDVSEGAGSRGVMAYGFDGIDAGSACGMLRTLLRRESGPTVLLVDSRGLPADGCCRLEANVPMRDWLRWAASNPRVHWSVRAAAHMGGAGTFKPAKGWTRAAMARLGACVTHIARTAEGDEVRRQVELACEALSGREGAGPESVEIASLIASFGNGARGASGSGEGQGRMNFRSALALAHRALDLRRESASECAAEFARIAQAIQGPHAETMATWVAEAIGTLTDLDGDEGVPATVRGAVMDAGEGGQAILEALGRGGRR